MVLVVVSRKTNQSDAIKPAALIQVAISTFHFGKKH
jgi:hypothetical protein